MRKESQLKINNGLSEDRVIKKSENLSEWQKDGQLFSNIENLLENGQLFAFGKYKKDNPEKLTEMIIANKNKNIVYYVDLEKIKNYYDSNLLVQESSNKES